MCVDGLEEAADDPDVHCQNVQIFGDGGVNDWNADGAESEDHCFNRRGVLGCQTEGSTVLVVQLVNLLVERGRVQGSVEPVMPGIFKNKKEGDLVDHLPPGWERYRSGESAVLGHGVEQPDLRQFHRKMRKQDEAGASPLFSQRWHFLSLDLIFGEEGDVVGDHPWYTPPEVNKLVHGERHDAGGEDIVLHVRVPCCPSFLEDIEVYVVLSNIVKIVGVGDGRGGEKC